MNKYLLTHPDPYDVWMTRHALHVRQHFYEGALWAKLNAALIAGIDWLAPSLCRMSITRRSYPITVAQFILSETTIDKPEDALKALIEVSTRSESYGLSWGLGFPWMSKNGFYDSRTPFITHAPYAIEALLKLRKYPLVNDIATAHLNQTFKLLDALKIQFQTEQELALSYAPVEEPRIVTNANSYACQLYSLQARFEPENEIAKDRAAALARFIVNQQLSSGAWFYYADNEPGNFIDCFHSCFIIKNLLKAANENENLRLIVSEAIEKGKKFLTNNFFDATTGLVRRFVERDFLDPYQWDLYDQAEYLGILIDFGEIDEARIFHDNVVARFSNNGVWYCKIDLFGRRWGKNFLRWGIMPFHYQSSRLPLS